MRRFPFALLIALALIAKTNASVLMLDFGPTTPTGALTNSPYHSVSGSADTNWNIIQDADKSSGLVYSDGSAATGVGINLGRTAAGTTPVSTLVDLTDQPTGSLALGTQISAGVYGGNSVGKDGIYADTDQTMTRGLGVQITGLKAGTYDIFVTTRNTNSAGTYTMTTSWGTGAAGVNYDYSSYQSAGLDFVGTGATDSWVAEGNTGENYVKFTVTLDGMQALNLGIAATGAQNRGFLNSLEIVSTPEPTRGLLWMAGLVCLLLKRRR